MDKAKILLSYDLTKISKSKQMKINRSLHGSVSVFRYKGKEYRSETKGLVEEKEKFSRAVLLVDEDKAAKIIKLFKEFGVNWKKLEILIV